MKKTLTTLALGLAAAVAVNSASAMTITAMDNADNLAANILGSGVTISNVTYTGANVASGYFSGGTAAGIGIESGIVLTSGHASNLDGTSNTSDNITGDNELNYVDPDLTALIPTYTTHDTTVLEFDFQIAGPAGTTGGAYFQYVFGSEEYNESVGSIFFTDVFGFFMDGVNNALIPGTATPVAIDNINNDSYSEYYNDNDPGDLGTPTPFAFEYDGFTDVFQCSFTGLNVGQDYHVKLAIADAFDWYWDSGVFLKGSSFSNEPIPEPATMLLMGTGLSGLIAVRRRKAAKKA